MRKWIGWGRADVPPGIGRGVVQIAVQSAHMPAVVAVAAAIGGKQRPRLFARKIPFSNIRLHELLFEPFLYRVNQDVVGGERGRSPPLTAALRR